MRDKKTVTQTSAWMATICKILLFVSYKEGVLNWLNSEGRSASEGAPMARVSVRGLFVGREEETDFGGIGGFGEELVWSCYDQRSPRTLARYAPVCCAATRRLETEDTWNRKLAHSPSSATSQSHQINTELQLRQSKKVSIPIIRVYITIKQGYAL